MLRLEVSCAPSPPLAFLSENLALLTLIHFVYFSRQAHHAICLANSNYSSIDAGVLRLLACLLASSLLASFKILCCRRVALASCVGI